MFGDSVKYILVTFLWLVFGTFPISILYSQSDLSPLSDATNLDASEIEGEEKDSESALKEKERWDSFSNGNASSKSGDYVTIEDIIDSNVEYRYAAFDVPDPFVPPIVSKSENKYQSDVVNFLQQYDVKEIKVAGIWESIPGFRKAFVTAEEKGVTIQLGDPIGRNGGEVVAIEKNHIRVREFKLASDGTRQFRDIVRWLGGSKSVALGLSSGISSDNRESYENQNAPNEVGSSRNYTGNTNSYNSNYTSNNTVSNYTQSQPSQVTQYTSPNSVGAAPTVDSPPIQNPAVQANPSFNSQVPAAPSTGSQGNTIQTLEL